MLSVRSFVLLLAVFCLAANSNPIDPQRPDLESLTNSSAPSVTPEIAPSSEAPFENTQSPANVSLGFIDGLNDMVEEFIANAINSSEPSVSEIVWSAQETPIDGSNSSATTESMEVFLTAENSTEASNSSVTTEFPEVLPSDETSTDASSPSATAAGEEVSLAQETTAASVTNETVAPPVRPTTISSIDYDDEDDIDDPEFHSNVSNTDFNPNVRKVMAPSVRVATKTGINICTWNVFRFGPKKFEEPDPFLAEYKKKKIDMMVEQISNADILALQEFFDPTLKVMETLIAALNKKTGVVWKYVASPRVGRTVTSQEQYVFLYRSDIVSTDKNGVYPEDGEDIFSREPFFAQFKISKPTALKNIVLGTIHTEPKEAVREISGLIEAMAWAEKFFGNKDVMALGDYNGDCQYVRKSAWKDVRLFTTQGYKWFIPDGTDTASMKSECAFDRAVSKSELFKNSYVEDSMRVLDFVEQYGIDVAHARLLSDHFPVCLTFK